MALPVATDSMVPVDTSTRCQSSSNGEPGRSAVTGAHDIATRRDRCRGALLGTALGDALGAPFEGQPNVTIDALLGHLFRDTRLTWTDDTALTLALGEHLLAQDTAGAGLDEDLLVRRFAATWAADPHRGYGTAPPLIFQLVRRGVPWRQVASAVFRGEGSLGNGGATRVAPVGLIHPDPYVVAQMARRSAQVTHAHPLAQDGAALQAVAVHLAAASPAHQPLDPLQIIEGLRPHATGPYAEGLRTIAELLGVNPDPAEVAFRLGNGVTAPTSVPTALYALLRHPDQPLDAIAFAIRCGGETDTLAAMAGALAGARNGASALPEPLLDRVEDRRRITDLADALADVAVSG